MKVRWITLCALGMIHFSLLAQASAEVATNINGELRFRPEFRENADFNRAADDTQSFYGQRIRLGINARISPDLSGFVQFEDARFWGGDDPVTDKSAEKVDIHQGYVIVSNIAVHPLSLKVGRQELMYGDQRLVGISGWGNGRAFDALKLMYSGEIADLDFWTAKVTENNACSGGVGCTSSASSGQDTDFYGLYSTLKANPIPDSNLQGYLLYKYDGSTNLSEYTAGARLGGKAGSVDYTGEFAYQFGDKDTLDISAYALALEAGYVIPRMAWSPKVAIEYDLATGDDSSTDKDYKTFDQLYPTNHALYGYMDYQGWKNMNDIALKVSAKPSDRCWLYAAYHMFSLAEKKDAWYGADGNARAGFGASATNTEDAVGQEIDLLTRHTVNQNLKVEVGVSRFFAGDFIKNNASTAEDEDSTWAYLMGTVSF